MDNLCVTNKKILQFYSDNPNINFEAVNLIFIDLFDKLFEDMNTAVSTTINTQLLSNVEKLLDQVSSMKTSVANLNNDISSSIYIKFQESKREYIEDMKGAFSYNISQNNDRIATIIQHNTSQLIDRTSILLNDVIPKSNDGYYQKVMHSISMFHNSISEDTKKLLASDNREESLVAFANAFESKSNNLLQPIFTYINATEERITKNLESMKDDGNKDIIMSQLSEFLGKYKNSSYKGQFGENQLETVLNKLYPTAEVLNTTGIPASCDFRVNRNNLPTILFETKNYDRNVSIDEVKKFIRDIETQKCHGVFLSQTSGITSKQNFQIDIKGGNILVYVHNVDYCQHTIRIASDIIDALSDKIVDLGNENTNTHVEIDLIEDINKEYSYFIERKSSILNILKDFTKKLSGEIDEIKFPCLSKLLVSKCGTILNNENEAILCNICNQFKATSNKSMAAHQRACKKKQLSVSTEPVQKEELNIVINTEV